MATQLRRGIACGLVLLLFSLFLTSGCSTTTPDIEAHKWVKPKYTKAEGRFRGRWWSHYKRGRLFIDGEFWAEAEKDFRTALARRATDSLWTRTYGLHFMPEYFPHRELGVVLYQQDRIDDAIKHLETSLSQKHSARAAYYLGLARTTLVTAQNLDQAPPTFEILSPAPTSPVAGTTVVLKGVARDDTYVNAIWIDGDIYPLPVCAAEAQFSKSVTLASGQNSFEVEVEDLMGKRSVHKVLVQCDVDGPTVSFDEPVIIPGTVQGVAMDLAGVSEMSIAGQTALLTPTDDGLVRFSFNIDPMKVDGPLRYQCKDGHGNTTRGTLPIDAATMVSINGSYHLANFPADPMMALASSGGPNVQALGNGLMAVTVGPYMLLTATSLEGASKGPNVRFANLDSGQIYYDKDLAVDVEITSNSAVTKADVNGQAIQVIPGRTRQTCSTVLRLKEPDTYEITAGVTDNLGHTATHSVTIERKRSTVEEVGRLDVVLLGCDWRDPFQSILGDGSSTSDYIADQLHRVLDKSGRFKGIGERDPRAMRAILQEHELSMTLGDPKEVLALHKFVPAELLLAASVRGFSDSMEIVLKARSTETLKKDYVVTVARAEASGNPKNREELDKLIRVLALRLLQEIPRVQGKVALVKNDLLTTNLGKATHRVREYQKLVVFRKGDPITDPDDPSLILEEGNTEILGEAIISLVRKRTSEAQITKRNDDYSEVLIERGHFVVTK